MSTAWMVYVRMFIKRDQSLLMDMLKLSQNAQVPQPLRGMEYEKDKGPKEI